MEPANTIIQLCGGFQAVADMTGRDVSRIHRWTYPKERGGTGGHIPLQVIPTLLLGARKKGVKLRAEDLLPKAPKGANA